MSPWYLFLELIIFLYWLEYKPESNERQTWESEKNIWSKVQTHYPLFHTFFKLLVRVKVFSYLIHTFSFSELKKHLLVSILCFLLGS